jgi:hypothetical protein
MSPAVIVPAMNTLLENVEMPVKVDNPVTDNSAVVVKPVTFSAVDTPRVPIVAMPVILAFLAVNSSNVKSSAT